ncbi:MULTISPECIES: hypothetical protein [unclassified Bradyrhizobium]|uniref:hypothetical protein n=1 Tax=unclassified Bradyrhizobium TaxID=2631580 RepID=UPI001CD429E4|nr:MULTISPECIES: hypothetical protein [unclassified Bradyrhizobium]MCA1438522.1 hypothetical protein [Bradyrhizobium sp. BRP20]MCA1473350.1 hypothetical protein [Bradyrhizobium sp. IC3195]MCA1502181.1 hypothetical protein [Bradyrhizobium sp. NBAIM14]MCA1552515.1 hypothetical protein [Bradyrhizobium sp. BRP19]
MEFFAVDHDTIRAELMYLESLGSRISGSKSHDQLVEHVKQQWADFGMRVHEDVLHFDRWSMAAENPDGLRLKIDGRDIAISSVFPYSGTTGPLGTEKQLYRLRGPIPRWTKARGGIAVVEVRNREFPFDAAVKTWDRARAWGKTTMPLLPATFAGLGLARARRAGVEAVIFAWRGISIFNAKGQYLPFTLPYQNIPAVFVAGDDADFVLDAASRARRATLILDAVIERNSAMRTVWAAVEGRGAPHETVLVVSHSDGTNIVEENGHIGVVELARQTVAHPLARTVIFVLTAGHLRIPAVTEDGQATSRWLRDHPQWWAGGPGDRHAVAGLVIEHLGAREYRDNPLKNTYGPTGNPAPELLYASTAQLTALIESEWRTTGQAPRVSAPNALIQFGEGQPLYLKGIPNIALVTVPQYLLSIEPGDYVDVALLDRQVSSFARLLQRIDTMPSNEIGTVKMTTPLAKAAAALRAIGILAGSSLHCR